MNQEQPDQFAREVNLLHEVMALVFETKNMDAKTAESIGTGLVDFVVDELTQIADDTDVDQESRSFAALAVCRILSVFPFSPVIHASVTTPEAPQPAVQ